MGDDEKRQLYIAKPKRLQMERQAAVALKLLEQQQEQTHKDPQQEREEHPEKLQQQSSVPKDPNSPSNNQDWESILNLKQLNISRDENNETKELISIPPTKPTPKQPFKELPKRPRKSAVVAIRMITASLARSSSER